MPPAPSITEAKKQEELRAIERRGKLDACRDYLVFFLSVVGGFLALSIGSLAYFLPSALPFETREPLQLIALGTVLFAGPKGLKVLKKIFDGI